MSRHLTRRKVLQAGTAVGACAGLGVLTPVMGQPLHTPEDALDRWHRGICGLCGMGDPLFLGVSGGVLKTVKGDALSPVGHGRLCTRGMAFPAGLDPDRRLPAPLLRRDPATKGTDKGLEQGSWDEAMAFLAERLGPLLEEGPRVGLLLDDSLPCESHFVFGKLFREHLGSPLVECPARFGAFPGLDAAMEATGVPGPTGSLEDLNRADLVMVVGADPAARNATLLSRLAQCRRRGTTRVVLIDPRRTGTVGVADIHVRPKVPGTEGIILQALAQILVREGVVVGPIPEAAREVDPSRAAEQSGARLEDIEAAGEALAESGRTVSVFGPGLRQPAALYNLHALSGRLTDGSTVIPVADGANAAGAWLMGSRHETHPLSTWLDDLTSGKMKAMLTIGGNPLALLPDAPGWRDALASRLLITATPVQPTETTFWSDLVLPMALPWAEERGCYINHERRVQLSDPAGPPEGALTSLSLGIRLARALLEEPSYAQHFAPYEEYGAELAWEHARMSTEGEAWDLSGLEYGHLTGPGGQHWPYPKGTEPGSVQEPVFAQISPIRNRLVAPSQPQSQVKSSDFPLHLMIFASAHHHGGRELTGFVPELHYAAPRAWVEVSGRDASKAKLSDGGWVVVESAHGKTIARLWITDRVPRGVVAIPEGFGFCSDLEGGTDGRAEPESLASSLLPADGASTRVRLRAPTEEEMAVRVLRPS